MGLVSSITKTFLRVQVSLLVFLLLSTCSASSSQTSQNNKAQGTKTNVTQAETDALLRSIWNKMKSEVMAGNYEKALEYYHESSKQEHREIFATLGAKLKTIFSSPEQLILLEINLTDGIAKYEDIVTEEDGKHSYPLVFIKEPSGVWKILDY